MNNRVEEQASMNEISRSDMAHITIIKTNLKDIDPRLCKEIDALLREGHRVTLLCWDRECQINPHNTSQNNCYQEVRLRLKSPYGSIKILFFQPIWFLFELYWLLKIKSDCIHSINFDTIIPAIIVGVTRKCRVIYEMYDIYYDEFKLPDILRSLLLIIDKICMRKANAVIVVDECRIEQLNGIPNANIKIIYNSPPDRMGGRYDRSAYSSKFKIFYAGILTQNRSIEQICQSVIHLEDVTLIIAGFGDMVEYVNDLVGKYPEKFQFLGKINYDDVLRISLSSDLLFSLYDPDVIMGKYASPNKLFEAMMCAKPILVSEGTAMANIVRQENCGLVVPCDDTDAISKAIIRIKSDPLLKAKLGRNGRKAYEERYNWDIMERRLINAYHDA